MQREQIPGFQPRWICVEPGCPKGRYPRLGPHDHVQLDMSREQARTKIQRLLALANSTTFSEEAATARAIAKELSIKHKL